MKIKPCRLSKQLNSVTENPFVFCGYKVSRVIGQNTHSRNIFSVHGFLNLSVIPLFYQLFPNKCQFKISSRGLLTFQIVLPLQDMERQLHPLQTPLQYAHPSIATSFLCPKETYTHILDSACTYFIVLYL